MTENLFDVSGKCVAITGAAGVLCGQLARDLAARGAKVALLDVMYDNPSHTMVKEEVISEDVIYNKEKPIVVYENVAESA